MTAVAPQDPAHAAKEIERGVKLGFKAVIINSHTHGEYLDDPKFWPILEAAEALDLPLYLHPQHAAERHDRADARSGLDGAIFGFGGGDRHARAAHDHHRRVRPLPEAAR